MDLKMVPRKNIFVFKILLLILLISSTLFIFLKTKGFSGIVNIRIYPDRIINNNFYGFGIETLPWLWTRENKEAGVNEEDIRLNLERIKDMYLPITRIFVPWETWNPSVDYKTFTWENDRMRSLYKILDFYQEIGTKVILVTVDWLKDSPWKNIQASAQTTLRLLEYLIKDKGYSCVQFWTLTNEPESTYGWLRKLPFENYVQIHRLIKKGLKERRLLVKIIASDEVESQVWFKKSVQHLYGVADIFSSHAYFYPKDVNLIPDFFRERLNIIKRTSLVKRDTPFFLCEFGFRGSDFGPCTNNLVDDYEYGLYVARLCINVLNSGVDAASLWCLHQIRLIDEIKPEDCKIMRIGLWAYKDKNWRPFPIFYLYRLFTRYIKSDSKVVKVKVSPPDILKVACVKYEDNYSLFIVNLTNKEQTFLIKGIDSGLNFKKYLYVNSKFPINENNSLQISNRIRFDNYLEDRMPPMSVILYTDLLR